MYTPETFPILEYKGTIYKDVHCTVCNSKNPGNNTSIDREWMNKLQCIHIMEYHTIVKMIQLQLYITQNKKHEEMNSILCTEINFKGMINIKFKTVVIQGEGHTGFQRQ